MCTHMEVHVGCLPLFCVNLELTDWLAGLHALVLRSKMWSTRPIVYMGSGYPSLLTSQQAIYPPSCFLIPTAFPDPYKGHADCLTGASEGALFFVPEECYLVMCFSLHSPTVKHCVTSYISSFFTKSFN